MSDDASTAKPDMPVAEIGAVRRKLISATFDNMKTVFNEAVEQFEPFELTGRVHKALGTIIHASIPGVSIGEIVELRNSNEQRRLLAECVGFLDRVALLSPIGGTLGIKPQTMVRRTGRVQQVAVGPELLGRVLNGLGEFIDYSDQSFTPAAHYDVYRSPPPPLSRRRIETPLVLGIRALDGLLTCGEGQRMGIFAASGVGKSVLLSMLGNGAAVPPPRSS